MSFIDGGDRNLVALLNSLPDDLTASGLKDLIQVGENIDPGDTLFLQNDGKYWKSDADAGATMPVLYLAIETILANARGLVLKEGHYRNDARYAWTPGAGDANLLFAHTTPGELVQLANQPAGAGDMIQVCGHIVNANQIYFQPSLELIEHS
jgi:hypothetical protein